jgi:hypothetical protein
MTSIQLLPDVNRKTPGLLAIGASDVNMSRPVTFGETPDTKAEPLEVRLILENPVWLRWVFFVHGPTATPQLAPPGGNSPKSRCRGGTRAPRRAVGQ